MEGYGPETYGDRVAAEYDRLYGTLFDADAAADFLARLADRGRALELGVGTGRIALPLKDRGIDVAGIDSSEAMVARLREKEGGRDIPVTIDDFVNVEVESSFAVVFVAFNTFFALPSQDDQIRCFENVAAHLDPGGRFVIEAFVPDLARFDRHQRVQANSVSVDDVSLEITRHDPVAQTVSSQIVTISDRGIRTHPVFLRYAYPGELDLMARLAGLSLEDRHGGWNGEPFTSDSKAHVSVYRK